MQMDKTCIVLSPLNCVENCYSIQKKIGKEMKKLTTKPKFCRLIWLKNHFIIASKNENMDTNAIKLAIMQVTGLIIVLAPIIYINIYKYMYKQTKQI